MKDSPMPTKKIFFISFFYLPTEVIEADGKISFFCSAEHVPTDLAALAE
jgi:hypothetical protein